MQDDDVKSDLVEAIQSGDTLKALTGLRDHIARELDGNRCSKCAMSHLKSGDQASLILRLQQILKEISEIKPVEKSPDGGNVRSLDSIRGNRDSVASAPDDAPELGTKNAPRRQGGPRRRGLSS